MNIKTITVNGIVAALYVAVTALIQPIAFGAVQYRVPEMFNHLVVFNKKYFFGIVLGVFFANLFFSPMKALDLTFGVGHSIISLGLTILISRYIKNVWARMVANSVVFSALMFIIAFAIHIGEGFVEGFPFAEVYVYLVIGEFVVMAIGMPIMYALNKRINFHKTIES